MDVFADVPIWNLTHRLHADAFVVFSPALAKAITVSQLRLGL
jgi:hypothetical protein